MELATFDVRSTWEKDISIPPMFQFGPLHQWEQIEVSVVKDDRSTPPIPPERWKLANADIKFLSDIIKQLVELREEEPEDDFGELRPSKLSFDAACGLLVDAAIVSAGAQIPYGHASTDCQGGIRIEWSHKNIAIRLVVSSDPERKPYLYHETSEGYATEVATAESLSFWLAKLR
jgi:hypothetical protein